MVWDPTIYEYDEVHDNIEDDSVVEKWYMQEQAQVEKAAEQRQKKYEKVIKRKHTRRYSRREGIWI